MKSSVKSPTLSPILDIGQSGTAEFSTASLKNNFYGNTTQQEKKLSMRVQWVPALHKQWQTQTLAFVSFDFIYHHIVQPFTHVFHPVKIPHLE